MSTSGGLSEAQIEILAWLQRNGPMPRSFVAGPALDGLFEKGLVDAAESRPRLGVPGSKLMPRVCISAEGGRALASATVFDPAMTQDETLRMYRGVVDPCARCRGWGVRWYGNTSTWRGGMGGARMTRDVCDACWGSGDASCPWPSRHEERERAHALAAQKLHDALGFLPGSREALAKLLEDAVRLAGRRSYPVVAEAGGKALLVLLRAPLPEKNGGEA